MQIFGDWIQTLKHMTKPLPPVFDAKTGLRVNAHVFGWSDKQRLRNYTLNPDYLSGEKLIAWRGATMNVNQKIFQRFHLENKQNIVDTCELTVRSNAVYHLKP